MTRRLREELSCGRVAGPRDQSVYLARHGQTAYNRIGRFQGQQQIALDETGRAQARELAEQLAGVPFDAVFSSDLKRAHETAELVAAPHGVPVVTDPELREIDVGSWSGLTRAEIRERFPNGERPDGETHEQHAARIVRAVTRIARDNLGRRILLVGHGGTFRSIHDVISEEPYHPVPNCHVLEVHFRDDRLVAPIG